MKIFFFAGLLWTGLMVGSVWAQEVPAQRVELEDTDQDGFKETKKFYRGDDLFRVELDRNKDGKTEIWIFFENGKLVRSEVDRNGDQIADLVRWMKDGLPDRERADLDFDGKPDAWVFYQAGMKSLMWLDKNKDGSADARFYYGQAGMKLIGGQVDEDFDGIPDRTFGAVPEGEETRKPF